MSSPARPPIVALDSGESHKKLLDSSEDGRLSTYTAQTRTAVAGSRRFEDTTHLIPSPGYNGIPPEKYNPLLMRLPIILGEPFLLLLLGLGLEIVAGLSERWQGFRVPASRTLGLFGTVSSQFLASFIPTFLIIPPAVLWRELDWMIRMYQPYIVLAEGNSDAERSVLLNYIEIGPILTIPRALKYKHRLVFLSALTASLTYLFQPFTASVFQIRQIPWTRPWQATALETVARAPDIDTLQAFVAGAGFADAAVLQNLDDPSFIRGGWAVTRFTFPLDPLIGGNLTTTTVAVRSQTNCSNPATQQLVPDGTTFNLSATSIYGCSHTVSFDPDVAVGQYGVEAIPCAGPNNVVDPDLQFRPVMFWFFHRRRDSTPEGKAVFCYPKLSAQEVTVLADTSTGRVYNIIEGPYGIPENDVINGPNGGRMYNGVAFPPNPNPFIQARASAANSIVPAAIFRSMERDPEGLDAVFDAPNRIMDMTSKTYTQHLSMSAKGIYFVPANSTIPLGSLVSYEPRLVVDPFPAHFLASILILTGIIGTIIHVLHRNQRKKLRLSAEPGTIAAALALTSRSGWGHLITPYDGEITMEKKLDGLKFSLDKRTGAIIATDESGSDQMQQADDVRMSLLSGGGALTPPLSSTFSAYQAASGAEPWSPNPKTPVK